jgi:hypothetical protein
MDMSLKEKKSVVVKDGEVGRMRAVHNREIVWTN